MKKQSKMAVVVLVLIILFSSYHYIYETPDLNESNIQKFGKYYTNLKSPEKYLDNDYYKFDNQGIVMVNYKEYREQYNPVTISQYALSCFEIYIRTGKKSIRLNF